MTFALSPKQSREQTLSDFPVSMKVNHRLRNWIRIDSEGFVTVFTGKAELGQGILTALSQIAAEELDVPLDKIRIIGPDKPVGGAKRGRLARRWS